MTLLWKRNIFSLFQNAIRFLLWIGLTVNMFILSAFSVAFTFRFTRHLWAWLGDHVFDEPW